MDAAEQDRLNEIAYDAWVITEQYPAAAKLFADAVRSLEFRTNPSVCGTCTLPEEVEAAANRVQSCATCCDTYRHQVERMAKRVAVALPDVSKRLRLVTRWTSKKWHAAVGFDWEAALAELRDIQTEALRRAIAPDDAKPVRAEAARGKVAGFSRPAYAQAAVICYFMAYPNSDPTAEQIAVRVDIDAPTVRNTPAWKDHVKRRARAAKTIGDAADIGDFDESLEELAGPQERGSDRRKLRRRA